MRSSARWWLLAALTAGSLEVPAARLRVVAAAELALDPRVAPDGTVTLALRARDDHGTAVRGHVRVQIFVAGLPVESLDGETDAHGDAVFEVPLPSGQHAFRAVAELVASTSTASARREADIDLVLPFVTVELSAPPVVDLTARDLEVDVTVHVGEVVPANPSGWPVALFLDGRASPMVAAVDDTGFHAFHVPLESLAPGIATLHAVYSRRGGSEVRTIDRRVVLRAATRMTLARLDGSASRVVGTLDTARGPVIGAPVQVMWGACTAAAALTDARGNFVVEVDPDAIGVPGVVLVARFDPGEPWFLGSRSNPVVLTLPEARRISWRWVLAPVGLGLTAIAIGRWLRRRASRPVDRVSIPTLLSNEDVLIERIAEARSRRVAVELAVEDRATARLVDTARAIWTVPPLGEHSASEKIEIDDGTHFECVVRADGYAPRTVSSDLPRGGDYLVRVSLRTWREELFERARVWMRRAGVAGAPSLPTPREVLDRRSVDPRAAELVGLIEEGTYGEVPPDAGTVASADAMSKELDTRSPAER